MCLSALFLAGEGPLSQRALDGLQTRAKIIAPAWSSRNAIVLLGVGTSKWTQTGGVTSNTLAYSRIFEAARLYFDCRKTADVCRILTSGGDPLKNGISEAESMARELKEIGVNGADVIVESHSNNTFQNARFSSEILRSGNFDLVLLVTSGVHMTRALIYFSHFLEKVVPAPSDQLSAIFSVLPTARNIAYLDIALHEYIGIWRYWIYTFLGWNGPRLS